MSRIVAAMSGGVDSSVAAALLAPRGRHGRRGHRRLDAHARRPARGLRAQPLVLLAGCRRRRRRVAQILGIPFFVLNVEREFGARVIDAFVDAYLDGATPNPCQACNQYIKFDELLRRGLAAYGADAVATGHYARLEHRDGRWRLLRAADADKDQTYFLWVLDQEQLAARASRSAPSRSRRSAPWRRPDPADGAEAGVAGDLLRPARRLPRAARGAARLRRRSRTDRRRRGHAGRHAHRLRALHRRPAPRLGRRARRGRLRPRGPARRATRSSSAAATRWPSASFSVDGACFTAGEPPRERFDASVRIRHRAPDVPAEVTMVGNDRFVVETAEPVWAPAPGQAACSTTATSASAGDASPAPRPERRDARAVADLGPAAGAHQPADLRGHPRPMGPNRARAGARVGRRRRHRRLGRRAARAGAAPDRRHARRSRRRSGRSSSWSP